MSARLGIAGAGLLVAGVILMGAGSLVGGTGNVSNGAAGFGMMGGGVPGGMMGGAGGMMGGLTGTSGPGPGEAGFVAGAQASPRIVRVLAGPGYAFTPSTITVARGETVTFAVTSMGGLAHEFMVGPADAVAADQAGTPEVADIGMMQTESVTYTFDGAGPYAFACHAAGHYEAGMKGVITVVG
ncbi:MAG: cupredoxin domain-containing protein [Candidatus Limnocylindrales bacterium]